MIYMVEQAQSQKLSLCSYVGNMANVPCLSLALLAFTSQVLSSLQRSGGMYH